MRRKNTRAEEVSYHPGRASRSIQPVVVVQPIQPSIFRLAKDIAASSAKNSSA